MLKTVNTPVGPVSLHMQSDDWNCELRNSNPLPGLTLVTIELQRDTPAALPPATLSWVVPAIDIQYRWHPFAGTSGCWLPPDWSQSLLHSELAIGAPVVSLCSHRGANRMTFAFSDALNPVDIRCGIRETDSWIQSEIHCFNTPAAPVDSYFATLRIDTRTSVSGETAVADVAAWWAAMPEYHPCSVPEVARMPFYSTWYGFHQDIFDHELEEECRLAREYGMEGIIVDDGWQTDDNSRGYAFCGDWEICLKRFPRMREHVDRVHALGMKYLLWYSLVWAGYESEAYRRFSGKFLYHNDRLRAAALDPRFPEVREYLLSIYERALIEWNLDGFKFDFIDSFRFQGEDPAVAENYAGRDYKLLPRAVDRLLTDAMTRLRAIRPEILIEFRQGYIGPAMRKYGNIFRVGDCPGDVIANRTGIINIRRLAGSTAVHSDMLTWNYKEPVESAALQLLNVLFAVPQISVRLREIPQSHRRMLKFYLDFWREFRDVLLDGKLHARQPEFNDPVITAEKENRRVSVIYAAGCALHLTPQDGGTECIVNASGCVGFVLELDREPVETACFDAQGNSIALDTIHAGLNRVSLPPAGMIRLRF